MARLFVWLGMTLAAVLVSGEAPVPVPVSPPEPSPMLQAYWREAAMERERQDMARRRDEMLRETKGPR